MCGDDDGPTERWRMGGIGPVAGGVCVLRDRQENGAEKPTVGHTKRRNCRKRDCRRKKEAV